MFTVGQALRIPNHLYLPFSPWGTSVLRAWPREPPHQGKQKEGALEADFRWVGREQPLPGSLSISQPVHSVFSLNNGGVYHSCEVITFTLIMHSESYVRTVKTRTPQCRVDGLW